MDDYFSSEVPTFGGEGLPADAFNKDARPSWLGFESYADFNFAEFCFDAGLSNSKIDSLLERSENTWFKAKSEVSFKSHRDLLKVQKMHQTSDGSEVCFICLSCSIHSTALLILRTT